MVSTIAHSFTKDKDYTICVSKDFLNPNDKVVFIDDFLANGNAAIGIYNLIKEAGAELYGMGFIIEKSFQDGGQRLRELGIHIESLAKIKELGDNKIIFED